MSDPSDRPGFVLPGMPWFSEIKAEGRILTGKWQIGRKTPQNSEPEASEHNTVHFTIPAGVCQPLGSGLIFT